VPKRVPTKLPPVTGKGPVAAGFRVAFDKINEIIDQLESLQPSISADSLLEHTDTGVARRPAAKAKEETEEGGEARWA